MPLFRLRLRLPGGLTRGQAGVRCFIGHLRQKGNYVFVRKFNDIYRRNTVLCFDQRSEGLMGFRGPES